MPAYCDTLYRCVTMPCQYRVRIDSASRITEQTLIDTEDNIYTQVQ